MKSIILTIVVFLLIGNACTPNLTQSVNTTENAQTAAGSSPSGNKNISSNSTSVSNQANSEFIESQTPQPKTVRDFFNLLPQKYFTLEGCDTKTDKNCDKARKEYIQNFLEIEDTKNGYWKSGCDGAQSCLTMALFKRPDTTYIIHLLIEFELGEESYFLEYKDGKWSDISLSVIPNYSQKNIYLPPRQGTTVEVFKKNFSEPEISERGAKIYDLTWNNGKFSIKK